ncbi:MAG: glutamyl-tRNA amidotransferase [Bdellovibrio sp.]|nr:MAG: glutamyl-tRNA amidotransferase [Bdellovibrio sp.]
MEIREKILADMKVAMREKDQVRLDTIRFLQAAIKYREIECRPNPMTVEDVMSVIKKLVKQRKESIEQFQAAQRQDLVDKENTEVKILESYLPAQMSREQVDALVDQVVAEVKATSIKDMGAVMKAAIAKSQGMADNKMLSEVIKTKLK